MSAYYNEHDPFAAAWLRELIKAGLIAPGDVDERSIEDVTPHELKGYTQHHFFAGVGVWSLALREAGWRDDRPVWTGSCPCQPFSAAGKGKGFADQRHLWPAFFHLIEQCAPAIVVGEQVASKDGLAWLDLVSADMEGARYAFGAVDTCAAGFGAPHWRQRLYWIGSSLPVGVGQADANGKRLEGRDPRAMGRERATVERSGCASQLADANSEDGGRRRVRGRGQGDGAGTGPARERFEGLRTASGMADADQGQRGRIADGEGCEPDRQAAGWIEGDGEPQSGGGAVRLADADGGNAQIRDLQPSGQQRFHAQNGVSGRGRDQGGEHRGHGELARPGPVNGLWRAADWLFCRDGKWRPVEPGAFPLVDAGAVRNRLGALRGSGNALNLAQAAGFLEAVLDSIGSEVAT